MRRASSSVIRCVSVSASLGDLVLPPAAAAAPPASTWPARTSAVSHQVRTSDGLPAGLHKRPTQNTATREDDLRENPRKRLIGQHLQRQRTRTMVGGGRGQRRPLYISRELVAQAPRARCCHILVRWVP